MLDEIKENANVLEALSREIEGFAEKLESANPGDRKLIEGIIDSVKARIKVVNSGIPEILRHVSLDKDVPVKSIKRIEVGSNLVSINVKDSEEFLEQLKLSKGLIKRLRDNELKQEKELTGFRKYGLYSKISNRFFLKTSLDLIEQGKFKSLIADLRKSNINVLSSTYISIMFFSTFLSIILGVLVFIFLMFFNVGFSAPFVSLYDGSYLIRVLRVSWVIIAVPVAAFLLFYFYPGTEKNSVAKKIDRELPFMVIQMGSISGSGIEPVEIFKIIGLGEDYKYASKEVRKLLNQINVYGYDLVTALTNVAHSTPSTKLSELFGGLAITISSGGDLKTYFEKRADTLLLEYALERERFTKVAETFMDIYISVVIATPMILLLLLIMIAVSGAPIGLSVPQLSILIILVVAVVNVLFLIFLHMKQPSY